MHLRMILPQPQRPPAYQVDWNMFYQDVKPHAKPGVAALAARPVFADSGQIFDQLIFPGAHAQLFGVLQAAHPVRLRMEMVEVVMAAVPGGSGPGRGGWAFTASAQAMSRATGSKLANMPTLGDDGRVVLRMTVAVGGTRR